VRPQFLEIERGRAGRRRRFSGGGHGTQYRKVQAGWALLCLLSGTWDAGLDYRGLPCDVCNACIPRNSTL
jgi:hypothetical protein